MERLLTLDEARAITGPLHGALLDAHREAWDDWKRFQVEHPSLAKGIDRTARANMLHCAITDRVGAYAGGKLYPVGGRGLFLLPAGDDLLIRFKLLDAWDLSPSSFPTHQQVDLLSQIYSEQIAEQLTLDGVSMPRTFLTCGHVLSATEDEISQVVIVCHVPEVRYYYDIAADEGTGFAEVRPLPSFPPKAPRVVSAVEDEKPAESTDSP